MKGGANGFPARTIVLLAAVMLVGGGVVAWLAVQEGGDEGGLAVESASVRSYVESELGPYAGVATTVFEDTVPACAPCELRLNPVGTFGSVEDSVLLGDLPVMVDRDSRGRFYAAVPVAGYQHVILYDSDGRVVRTVGREGQGPGEFRTSPVSLLVDPGDSLWVSHDGGLVSVFDSAGAPVRTVRLDPPFRASLVRVDEEGILVAGQAQDPDLRSFPIHLFDHGGRHLHSFGSLGLRAAARSSRGGPRTASPRVVGRSTHGALWLAEVTNYRLDRVDERGETTRVVAVRGPDSWNTRLHMSTEEYLEDKTPLVLLPRPLRLGGIHQIRDDLLVVVLNVPALDWETAELSRHHRFPDDKLATEVHQALFDAVVDVIHLPTGSVLARTRLPTMAYATAVGTVYTTTVDDLGVIRIEAFEVELVGFDG